MSRETRQVQRLAYRRDEAADAVGVSVSTFDQWVKDGLMPKPRKIGGVVLWDVRSVNAAWDVIQGREPVDSSNPWD